MAGDMVEKQKTFKEKFKEFFSFKKKTEQQTVNAAIDIQRIEQAYATNVQWNVPTYVNGKKPGEQQPAKTRIDFSHGVSDADMEKSYKDRENTLIGFAQEKQTSLGGLYGSTREDYQDMNYQNIRMLLDALNKVFPQLQSSMQSKNQEENKENLANLEKESQDWLKYYRNLLDKIYVIGETYLNESSAQAQTNTFVEQQRKLVSQIMSEANDALLAADRMTLIQQEREFMQEDMAGETIKQAADDGEINNLPPDLIKAIEFYTSNEKYSQGIIGYQWLNGIYRGKYKIEDLPKGKLRNYVLDAMEKIDKALNRGQEKSKRLYRGTNLTPAFGDRIKKPELLVGQSFCDKGYLSTSRNRWTALSFLTQTLDREAVAAFVESRMENSDHGYNDSVVTGNCLLEIVARKGAHSLDLTQKSIYKSEAEVLFKPGTYMYIHSMRTEEKELPIGRLAVQNYLATKHMENYLNAIFPEEWKLAYFKVKIPIFEVEIR